MEEAALKIDLHDKIEHADFKQLKELYGLITNYFNGQDTIGEWDSLSEYRKERILKSIEQADSGLYLPAKEVIQRSREKFSLNG